MLGRTLTVLQLFAVTMLVTSGAAAKPFSEPTRELLVDACTSEVQRRRPPPVTNVLAVCGCIFKFMADNGGVVHFGNLRIDLPEADWLQIASVMRQGVARYVNVTGIDEHVIRIAESLPVLRLSPDIKACAGS